MASVIDVKWPVRKVKKISSSKEETTPIHLVKFISDRQYFLANIAHLRSLNAMVSLKTADKLEIFENEYHRVPVISRTPIINSKSCMNKSHIDELEVMRPIYIRAYARRRSNKKLMMLTKDMRRNIRRILLDKKYSLLTND